MATLTFPQELIDIVISYNHDDKPTLSSCSLVCHTWERTSRTLLFRSLHLAAALSKLPTKPHPELERIRVPDFDAFGAQLPAFLPAVHELTISGVDFSAYKYELEELEEFYGADRDDGSGADDMGLPAPRSGDEQETTWTTLRLDELERVVRALPRLRSLTLKRVVLRTSNTTVGSLVQLEDLTLDNVGTFNDSNFLALFSVIGARHVAIHAFHRGPAAPLAPAQPLPGFAAAIEAEIHVEEGAEQLLGLLRNQPDVAHIRSLALHATQVSELVPFGEVLGAVGPALRRLELDLHRVFSATKPDCVLPIGGHNALKGGLNFALLKGLEVFVLKLRLSYDEDTDQTLITVWTLLLGLSRSSKSSVHTVILYLDFVWTIADDLQSISLSGLRGGLLKLPLRHLEVHVSKRQSEVAEAERPIWERYLDTEFPEWQDILTVNYSKRLDAMDWWAQ
ncbi:hypothetical protein PsYK624_019140 [Phanerochaete sordida]|uniref:F-box domain-containing protein n=1 Tax=Phanerochaete sordida TaxID=48140 RepID=A0A9P3G0S1_9APHY|nr:hypothetical protein PsYK624_019140 [Phanerochaete sordida]